MDTSTPNSPVHFFNNSHLHEDELLLYSLMTLVFPLSTFTKAFEPSKYEVITNIIHQITGIQYNTQGIRNYFYRVKNNKVKGIGKNKGICRWVYYQKNITFFLEKNKHLLIQAIEDKQTDDETINLLMQELKTHCILIQQSEIAKPHSEPEYSLDKEYEIKYVNQVFKTDIMPQLTSKWSHYYNSDKNTLHFYQFNKCPGYAERELELTEAGTWTIHLEGKQRSFDLSWTDIPNAIKTCNDLKCLLDTIGSLKVCQGYPFSRYKPLYKTHEALQSLFQTKDGTQAASVDICMSRNKEEIIRSSKCIFLLWADESISTPDTCEACKSTNHYLRTKLSRLNNKKENVDPAKVRYDYMSKNDLLEVARLSVKKMKYWRLKCKRLDEYRQKMTTVGQNTDQDLQAIFKEIYEAVSEKKNVLQNPVCRWHGCTKKFENVEILFEHSKQHIEKINTIETAPINRSYRCLWETCNKQYNKLKLLQSHLRDHTGFAKDELMEILLKDEAKALNTPAKQMRWHPLVIQWCLKTYCKSHSLYEGIRSSGALRLPSGRTLSDYKNFNPTQSGWQSETIKNMKDKFEKMKPPKHGKLGGLFFDEVKIKEGLVFDTSSWELIGFTDTLEKENHADEPTENLATHVLQFFYRSLFFKFDFPCAYFLTKGATAVQINRVFWLGISLLHSYGFDVMLVCCDGASTNRSFYTMNTTNKFHSEGFNPFTNNPIFFMSDPPHLMKKLRNNLYNSGDKAVNKRFTRKMRNNKGDIVWQHILEVYNREKLRRLYVTDLRSSHVNLDNLSKMRVKLAVQTLSSKVQAEMQSSDNNVTLATQEYISMCDNFWNVFNSSKPLTTNCDEITKLDDVVNYFTDWQKNLGVFAKIKAEQAKYFVSWQTMFDLMVS